MRLLFVIILFLITGCHSNQHSLSDWLSEKQRLRILSTTSVINDLVKQIGGDQVAAIALIRGELDLHSYELVKGDDEKFVAADLIFYNGLGLEHGLSLRQNLENNPRAVSVTANLVEKHFEQILFVEGQYDPHVWMDIALWMEAVEPIITALSERDPDHQELYRSRGEALLEKMRCADTEAFLRLQAIPAERRYLVTSHDAFNYFTRHYLAEPGEKEWILRCEAPEGLAPEAQISLSHICGVITHLEKYRICVLFPESNVSRDALKKIVGAAKERGLTIRLSPHTLYGDSMGDSASYLDMMQHNVSVIAEELERWTP